MSGTSFNIMSTYNTETLLDIVTKHSSHYSAKELEDAMNELKLRNVNVDNSAMELAQLTAGNKTQSNKDKKEVKMDIYLKILTLFFPFILTGALRPIESALGIGISFVSAYLTTAFIILLLFGTHYYIKSSGYIKMAVQFRNWTIASFILAIVLLLLELLLNALRHAH